MKKSLFVILFATIVSKGFGQIIFPFSYPSSVDLFGLCEISFDLPLTYSNPYDPDTINVYAEFTGPDNSSYTVNAFYYESYTLQQHADGHEEASYDSTGIDGWRIRFTPTVVGTWSFNIRAFDKNGELNLPLLNANHTFSCTSVTDADGFISMANSKFLKRERVRKGIRQSHSFFPIGPNVAWYSSNITSPPFSEPYGIYDYKKHVDSLDGNANYMRIWLNRYQYLSLYGPEYTQPEGDGTYVVYFDNTINQKDSAELDTIITYALQHGVSIMPCFFTSGDFKAQNEMDPSDPSIWANNPFNGILGTSDPCACDFFTNARAIKISKNLIRYIVSRWGYATNIMCWELWNEVDHVKDQCKENQGIDQGIKSWHDEMDNYIRSIDPFGHCITSSIGNPDDHSLFPSMYWNSMDIVQQHNYQNIQKAQSRFELPYSIYIRVNSVQIDTIDKPFFMGEFGFSKRRLSEEKDPHGVSLHNTLWSSLFSASIGPASFWWWEYVDSCYLYKRFKPMMNFCKNLPVLSETFTAKTTGKQIDGNNRVIVFENGLGTYYMANAAEDTIMGWTQDTAFSIQSLRWLTDEVRTQEIILSDTTLPAYYFRDTIPPFDPNGYVYTLDLLKRPAPSSYNNTITLTINNQPVGETYNLQWYDSETGSPFNMMVHGVTVQQDSQGNKTLSFQFPSHIRDIRQHAINNTFGDAVFILVRSKPEGPLPKE